MVRIFSKTAQKFHANEYGVERREWIRINQQQKNFEKSTTKCAIVFPTVTRTQRHFLV